MPASAAAKAAPTGLPAMGGESEQCEISALHDQENSNKCNIAMRSLFQN